MSEQTAACNDAASDQPKEPHTVASGRSPHHSKFPKGQSGNPKGRPKGSKNRRSELRKMYTERITVNVGGKRRRVAAIVAVARVQLDRALKGDHRAAEAVFKRAKECGVFDETEMPDQTGDLSDEDIAKLSDSTLAELLKIERDRHAERVKARNESVNAQNKTH
jgi:hypothetical protein